MPGGYQQNPMVIDGDNDEERKDEGNLSKSLSNLKQHLEQIESDGNDEDQSPTEDEL